ncbi:response regulator [Saccharibacillus brassicae]|uniref:response regulator n=3 Tax=Saccharibacillus TaxID=456492 RepID=UPI001238AAA9
MYKVIVADDEPLMLEGWKTMVDWTGAGYELCGAASDGEEALDLFGSVGPDLVVTDIRMPVLDGLELIRAIKNRPGAHARSVIVSGYAEFGYVQQALRFGADRYVLKPIVPEEIQVLLGDLFALLGRDRTDRASAAALQAAAEEAEVMRLLQGGLSGGPGALGLASCAPLCVLLLEAPCAPTGRARALPRAALKRTAERLRAAGTPAWTFDDGRGRLGLLAACAPDALESDLRQLAASAAGTAVYVSGPGRGPDSLARLYAQAIALRDRLHALGQGGVYRHDEAQIPGSVGFAECLAFAERILESVDGGEVEAVSCAVSDLFGLFGRLRVPGGWAQSVVRHLLGELLRREDSPAAASAPAAGRFDEDSGPAEAELLRRCTEAAERVRTNRSAGTSGASPIAEAIDYMRQHYRDKLQLRDLAARCHLNPVYFGQQFKRATGYGFNDYVHRLRAEEARKLLRRTDMKIAEIAGALGYHDTEYFSAKFKAVTGDLPSLYRTRERGSAE